MADSRAATLLRSARLAAFVVTATIFTGCAGLMMFSRFMLYDDEGYVLISLRNFAEHGRLYRDVYSQYGPVPYVVFYGLHLLGATITHTLGRIVTLAVWTGTVMLAAAIVWRLTRRIPLVVATVAALFTYLWVMANEPPHPGGIIILMIAALAAIGGHWLAARRDVAWAALAGAGAAALVLTKINIGVFAAASVGAFVVLNCRHDQVRRWAPVVIGLAFALLPFALMRQLWHAPWVQTYAIVFALSAAATVAASATGRTARFGGREIAALLAGAAGVTLGVMLVMLARGTTPGDLLQGVVLGPIRHPVSFSMAFKWAPGAKVVAVVSAALCGTALLLRRTGRGTTANHLVAVLRLAAGAGLLVAVLQFPAMSADNLVLAYGLSCLWCFAWPLAESATDSEGRAGIPNGALRITRPTSEAAASGWIVLLLLGQFLHPFPVPGSQIAWGTFLALPVAAIGAGQAGSWLVPHWALAQKRLRLWWFVTGAVLWAVTGRLAVEFGRIGAQYFDGRNLSLTGAEPVRLPDETTARYEILSLNALAHSDMLFSLPGMFSFNLWTGLPTPTLANVTHWFSLLNPTQQQEIIRELEKHPRAAVIVEAEHVEFLRKNHLAPAGPLYDYIEQTFVPAFTIDHFEFRVRKGRHVAPFFTAELFQRPAAGAATDAENTRLVMPLSLPADQQIASIELLSLTRRAPPLVLQGGNVRLEVTPITVEGSPRGPAETRALPLTIRGPASVALYFDGKNRPFGLSDTLIVLRNAAGAQLGLVRLRL